MNSKLFLCVAFITTLITNSTGALLFWSNSFLKISPLIDINDDNFDEFLQTIGNPNVKIYKSSSATPLPEFKQIIKGLHSAYNPNGLISGNNITEIASEDDLGRVQYLPNYVSILVIPEMKRAKRENTISTTTEPFSTVKPPKGPVFYRGQSKKDNSYTLMYSSQPLLLKVNNSNFYLGGTSPDMITVDTISRDSFSRLNVNIPFEGGKITLRFLFAVLGTYWSLTSVKISDNSNNMAFNLSTVDEFTAPARFSYHCNGDILFLDTNNNVELHLYDMQVQIDSKNGKFSDAYDCVPFTTGPIWSGLLVTAILAIGLIVALTAISDIKTMDKFDNYKTKQLAITVTE